MARNEILTIGAGLALVFTVGCGGADRTFETTEQEIITQPTTETVEVEVLAEDTLLVERQVETEVRVDTTRVDGDEVAPGTVDQTRGTQPGMTRP